ncbi:hypothetical protein BD309DRAFT_132555 [Dichomitus squalens]|nr:hypothetical protein BD309DRAFT_132555 [Dichomitus squalens]
MYPCVEMSRVPGLALAWASYSLIALLISGGYYDLIPAVREAVCIEHLTSESQRFPEIPPRSRHDAFVDQSLAEQTYGHGSACH